MNILLISVWSISGRNHKIKTSRSDRPERGKLVGSGMEVTSLGTRWYLLNFVPGYVLPTQASK